MLQRSEKRSHWQISIAFERVYGSPARLPVNGFDVLRVGTWVFVQISLYGAVGVQSALQVYMSELIANDARVTAVINYL